MPGGVGGRQGARVLRVLASSPLAPSRRWAPPCPAGGPEPARHPSATRSLLQETCCSDNREKTQRCRNEGLRCLSSPGSRHPPRRTLSCPRGFQGTRHGSHNPGCPKSPPRKEKDNPWGGGGDSEAHPQRARSASSPKEGCESEADLSARSGGHATAGFLFYTRTVSLPRTLKQEKEKCKTKERLVHI